MKCDDFLEKIEDFYLKELSGSEEDRMAEHVATCAHCEDAWMDYKQIEKALTELSHNEQVSSYTTNAIMQAAATHLENNHKSSFASIIAWFKINPAYVGALSLSLIAIIAVFNFNTVGSLSPHLEKNLVQEPTVELSAPKASSPEAVATSNLEQNEIILVDAIILQVSKGECDQAKNNIKKIKSQKNKTELEARLKHCN